MPLLFQGNFSCVLWSTGTCIQILVPKPGIFLIQIIHINLHYRTWFKVATAIYQKHLCYLWLSTSKITAWVLPAGKIMKWINVDKSIRANILSTHCVFTFFSIAGFIPKKQKDSSVFFEICVLRPWFLIQLVVHENVVLHLWRLLHLDN